MYIEDMITGTDTNAIRTGRQKELDIGKAIPILCLPFVHCIIECCTDEQLLGGIPFLFDSVIGGPMSAPMFLFCMGATIHFGRAHTPEKLARRGVYLILIGFLLNICRFFIPYMIGYGWTGDKEQFLTPLVYRVFGNDVLQFAGLAMLVMALFVWIRLPAAGMLAVALAMSVTGTFVRGIDLGNDTLNIAGGWLIGTVNEADLVISDFPILNWLIVPVAGYVFGGILRGVQDKHRFYLRFSPICLLVAVIAMAIGIHGEYGMFGEGQNAYYHISTLDVLICIALTLGPDGGTAAKDHGLFDLYQPKHYQVLLRTLGVRARHYQCDLFCAPRNAGDPGADDPSFEFRHCASYVPCALGIQCMDRRSFA